MKELYSSIENEIRNVTHPIPSDNGSRLKRRNQISLHRKIVDDDEA